MRWQEHLSPGVNEVRSKHLFPGVESAGGCGGELILHYDQHPVMIGQQRIEKRLCARAMKTPVTTLMGLLDETLMARLISRCLANYLKLIGLGYISGNGCLEITQPLTEYL
jgi:hypothetical protein